MEKKNQEFEKTLQSFSSDIQNIARQTRQLIYDILPSVVEVVWAKQKITGFGTGIKKKTEHFCWVMPLGNHVTLRFDDSVEPPDPKSLFEVYPLLIGLRDSEKKRFGKKSGSFSQRRTESRTKNSIEPF